MVLFLCLCILCVGIMVFIFGFLLNYFFGFLDFDKDLFSFLIFFCNCEVFFKSFVFGVMLFIYLILRVVRNINE